MARGLTSTMKTTVAKPQMRPIVFYEGEFVSGNVNAWTGRGPRVWNGKTWVGAGKLAGVGPVTESSGLKGDGVMVSLSGVPNDLVAKALTEVRHDKKGTLWIGFLDENDAIVADPKIIHSGRLDVVVVRKGKRTSTIGITYESKLLDNRNAERRYSNEDQKILHPADKGFEFITKARATNTGGVHTGSGVPCFSENVQVRLADGLQRFDAMAQWVTLANGRRASLLVHDFSGTLRDMGGPPGERALVTKGHLLRLSGRWVPAGEIFPDEVPYAGKVYNLHVLGEPPFDEQCYELENGWTAHNSKEDDGGGAPILP